ncbi:hypothetical protein [uncultured Thalassospira sp.]|uniref:hypothetical protein n=1 Tax=uncultured Thalassospira sp. TaxID=404382 RepID=UPI002582B1D0|nr:hypothetical protein [uncultured Thalassospira sp.]
MKTAMMLAITAMMALGVQPAPAQAGSEPTIVDQQIEHGGGCRKSSPPGQCCHMDRKAGTVHCH